MRYMNHFLFFIGIVLLSYCVTLTSCQKDTTHKSQNEKINLALRATASSLLRIQGDFTSRIPPVSQTNDQYFSVTLNQRIPYDTLPKILDAQLKNFEIKAPYVVSIKSCQGDTILLGFNYRSVQANQIACYGRDRIADCSKIELYVEDDSKDKNWMYSLFIVPVIAFLYFGRKPKKQTVQDTELDQSEELIKFHQTSFDFKNQVVYFENKQINLTFRENKLLQLFVNHPNQILDRQKIQEEIWEDEGILVGRSLDVFVSRLRKILKADKQISIKTIHGVGYKLEV